jgi:hypothetical protein
MFRKLLVIIGIACSAHIRSFPDQVYTTYAPYDASFDVTAPAYDLFDDFFETKPATKIFTDLQEALLKPLNASIIWKDLESACKS